MGKRIVIALGGNALGNNLPEQMIAVKKTASAIVDLIEAGNEVVIAHGNGPQVGMIQNAMSELTRSNPEKYIPCPLSVCVAMSQGYIGYDLQNALREEMLDRGINTGCTTILTQVEVDANDPAFENPTKPIGAFMTKEEADKLVKEKGYKVVEDAGRGYRRVVASPKPKSIIEIDTIRSLVENDYVVVACGGGGIPVFVSGGHHLKGAAAVIDKDFAAEKLAEQLDADCLIILTAVEKVAVHFGKPDQEWLSELTPETAQKYIEAGEFAPGSMLPKVQAAVAFAESAPGRESLITLLEKAKDGMYLMLIDACVEQDKMYEFVPQIIAIPYINDNNELQQSIDVEPKSISKNIESKEQESKKDERKRKNKGNTSEKQSKENDQTTTAKYDNKLPQTGQDRAIAVILATVGLVMIAGGVVVIKRNR